MNTQNKIHITNNTLDMFKTKISKKEAANSCFNNPDLVHVFLNTKQPNKAKNTEEYLKRFVGPETRYPLNHICIDKDITFASNGKCAMILDKIPSEYNGKTGYYDSGKVLFHTVPKIKQVLPDTKDWNQCKLHEIKWCVSGEYGEENILIKFPEDCYNNAEYSTINSEYLCNLLQYNGIYIDKVIYKDQYNVIIFDVCVDGVKGQFALMPVRTNNI